MSVEKECLILKRNVMYDGVQWEQLGTTALTTDTDATYASFSVTV